MNNLIYTFIVAFAVYLLVKILTAPLKLIFKLLINAAVGLVMLFVFNLIGSLFNFSIETSFVNCLVCGLLGIPGVILLIVIKILF